VFDLFSNCAFHKPTNKSLIGGPEKLKKKEDWEENAAAETL